MNDLGDICEGSTVTTADAEWTTNEPGGVSGRHWRVGRNNLTH
jgi:hypothetical protein